MTKADEPEEDVPEPESPREEKETPGPSTGADEADDPPVRWWY